uniref:Uncharacterized protein n=1 Tax=Acrobeloides nanus TaxID=290746 RepID=A0A914DZ11_9BILA
MKSLLAFVVLIIYVNQSYGYLGFDLPASQVFTTAQFNCFFNQSFYLILPQIYSANGEFEQIGLQNVVNARQSGLWADTIINPCRNVNNTCKNGLITGVEQALEIIKYVNSSSVPITYMNLQIQGHRNWPKDRTANQQFIMDFTNTIWVSKDHSD